MWIRTSTGIIFFNIDYTSQGIAYPTTPNYEKTNNPTINKP